MPSIDAAGAVDWPATGVLLMPGPAKGTGAKWNLLIPAPATFRAP